MTPTCIVLDDARYLLEDRYPVNKSALASAEQPVVVQDGGAMLLMPRTLPR